MKKRKKIKNSHAWVEDCCIYIQYIYYYFYYTLYISIFRYSLLSIKSIYDLLCLATFRTVFAVIIRFYCQVRSVNPDLSNFAKF